MIPVFEASLPSLDDVAPIFLASQREKIYSNRGPVLAQYEAEVARHFQVHPENVVILSSATMCLQGLVQSLNYEVWTVPDFTFAASGLAVKMANKQLELSDVEESTWMLNPSKINNAVARQHGVIPVAPFGAPIPDGLLDKPGVVLDAAASLGHPDLVIGELHSDSAVVFSVHSTKVLPAGEGGIAVCGSEGLAAELRRWSQFGFDSNRVSVKTGTNAKMSEVVAAFGLYSFRNRNQEISEWARKKRFVADFTRNLGLDNHSLSYAGSPYWILELDSETSASKLVEEFAARRIATKKWWPQPLSDMPAFQTPSHPLKNQIASDLAGRLVGLPFFRNISMNQLEVVFRAIENYLDSSNS